MLLRVKGMSAEKVGAVVESWDTPRALYEEAFRAAETEETEETEARRRQTAEEAELVASSAKGKGKGKKEKNDIREARLMLEGVGGGDSGVHAMGQALSTKIYQLMMSLDYKGEEN
jgi:reverse gyrase